MRVLDIQSVKDAQEEIEKIGIDNSAFDHLLPKLFNTVIKIDKVSVGAANIIKQTALSCGTDAAVARGVITGEVKKSGVLLFGNYKQIENIALKITNQPFGLGKISKEILELVRPIQRSDATCRDWKVPPTIGLNLKKHKFDFTRTYICGIINVTPDSFSDGGIYLDKERAIDRAYQIVEEGADMIDIGGESTRPGADRVSVKEELKRVMPVIEGLNLDIPLSIDTYKSEVAKEALDAGCEIVNDISGLRFDNDMADVIAEYDAGCIITHIKGTPKHMQENPHYESIIDEIIDYLKEGIEIAEKRGTPRSRVKSDRIMIDPGIGFGKRNPGDNLLIIKRLKEFKVLSKPIFIGISKKSFIGKVLSLPKSKISRRSRDRLHPKSEIKDRLEGSLAASVIAILNGANILRTHDVKETVKATKMADAIIKSNIKY